MDSWMLGIALLCMSAWHLKAEVLEEVSQVPLELMLAANLTATEMELLNDVRWGDSIPSLVNRHTVSGIPADIQCDKTTWCDDMTCTEVCKRGTVVLEDWFKEAVKSQIAISRELPLCYAQWLGTHNSGITLADGYGNRDRYYTELLQLTKWFNDSEFKTHNQLLSITDQLNMGARMIELDVHWVKGALRIAHCGGITSSLLNYIAWLVNLVAVLIKSPFRWDSETLGCYPSGSSIEAKDQRLLIDAMEEIADWMYQPGNENEFLIVLLDETLNLAIWDLLPELRKQLTHYIPYHHIFTPTDMLPGGFNGLPSAQTLIENGKRVMFLSSQYYSDIATRFFLFYTREGRICDWREPKLHRNDFQSCTIPPDRHYGRRATMTGQACRFEVCEIEYGPLSCQTSIRKPLAALDEDLLKRAFTCGYNFPSPDNLTPSRAAAAIWSWAPGHPPKPSGNQNLQTVISAKDGLWRTQDSNLTNNLPIACRRNDSAVHYTWQLQIPLSSDPPCPDGFIPGIPRNGKENKHLQHILKHHRVQGARLIGIGQYMSTDISRHFT